VEVNKAWLNTEKESGFFSFSALSPAAAFIADHFVTPANHASRLGWCGGLVEYLVVNPSCLRIFYYGHMNNKYLYILRKIFVGEGAKFSSLAGGHKLRRMMLCVTNGKWVA